MSLTILVGPPGTGKSKEMRRRYAGVGDRAAFLDGCHNAETVRQLRHEMGFFDHHYLSCSRANLWRELTRMEEMKEIFIDMPDLSDQDYQGILDLAKKRDWHLTMTARSVPQGLEGAEIIRF